MQMTNESTARRTGQPAVPQTEDERLALTRRYLKHYQFVWALRLEDECAELNGVEYAIRHTRKRTAAIVRARKASPTALQDFERENDRALYLITRRSALRASIRALGRLRKTIQETVATFDEETQLLIFDHYNCGKPLSELVRPGRSLARLQTLDEKAVRAVAAVIF